MLGLARRGIKGWAEITLQWGPPHTGQFGLGIVLDWRRQSTALHPEGTIDRQDLDL